MDDAVKIGTITHYYTHLQVGIIKLDQDLKNGDKVLFKGHTTSFEQIIDDMEFDHKKIEVGKKGQEIGVKVSEKVREGDEVFKV